jgi:hypothetical protein
MLSLPRAALLAGLASASCAHQDSIHDGVLTKGDIAVRLGPVPADWRPIPISGADLAFRDANHQGSVLIDVRCGQRDGDAPLSVLTEHLIMGTTERAIGAQATIPFDGREAMRTTLDAKLDGVPMRYRIYVMKKDGCVYDLVYVAPPEPFLAGEPAFERFVGSLHATARGEPAAHAQSALAPAYP